MCFLKKSKIDNSTTYQDFTTQLKMSQKNEKRNLDLELILVLKEKQKCQ